MKRAIVVGGFIAFCVPAFAEQSLSQAANDPTAALMNVQVNDLYTSDYHNLSGEDANQIQLRSAVPFQWGSQQHIFRVTIPVITDSPFLDEGVSDTTIFDLATFESDWGRWGAGVVGLLPTGGEKRGTEKWGVGPALGFIAQADKGIWGVFNQNIFTVAGDDDRADVNLSIVQPIVSYSLGGGWSVGTSDMSITYDWDASEFSSLPLGAKLSKLKKFGKVPVQLGLEYEYNFYDEAINSPKSQLRLSAKLLFPSIF